MKRLNFSWVINSKLAGHEGPSCQSDLTWLKEQGILALVRMAEASKSMVDHDQIFRLGLWDLHEPVSDFKAPAVEQIGRIIEFIDNAIAAGKPIGVSCKMGLGRTGTILACYLVHHGKRPDIAISEVRAKRPGSIETRIQEEAIRAYATRGY